MRPKFKYLSPQCEERADISIKVRSVSPPAHVWVLPRRSSRPFFRADRALQDQGSDATRRDESNHLTWRRQATLQKYSRSLWQRSRMSKALDWAKTSEETPSGCGIQLERRKRMWRSQTNHASRFLVIKPTLCTVMQMTGRRSRIHCNLCSETTAALPRHWAIKCRILDLVQLWRLLMAKLQLILARELAATRVAIATSLLGRWAGDFSTLCRTILIPQPADDDPDGRCRTSGTNTAPHSFPVCVQTVIRSYSLLRSISFLAKTVCSCVCSPLNCRSDPFASSSLGARQVRHSTCTWQFFLANGSRTDTSKHSHQHSWANTRRCASSIHTVLSFVLGAHKLFFFAKQMRMCVDHAFYNCVCVLDRRFSFVSTGKPMWSAKCSSVFSERAQMLGNVSQHMRHVVVKVHKLKQSLTGRGLNLESTVEIGFVDNVRWNKRAFGAQHLKFCFLECSPWRDLSAIALCGPAVECSTCGVLLPVREQFGLCDVHARTLR